MLTWFKLLYQKLMTVIQPEQKQVEEVVVEVRNQLHDTHDEIAKRLQHALVVNNHRAYDIERLEVLCDNVNSYINMLQVVEDSLLGRIDFPKEEFSLRLVKVCNFYRTADGRLTSIPEKRTVLINRMLSVLRVHQTSLTASDPPGWLSYALSRSVTVIVNIDSLSTQLVLPRLGDQ